MQVSGCINFVYNSNEVTTDNKLIIRLTKIPWLLCHPQTKRFVFESLVLP